MVDKLRRTFPLKITFGQGEMPTAAKLNGISEQARQGTNVLEYAVGDLWNQSGDSIYSSYPLQIPNLARLLGESSYLNPIVPALKYNFTFNERLTVRHNGDTEGHLFFKPSAGCTPSFISGNFTTLEADAPSVDGNANSFYVDNTTGYFKLGSPVDNVNDVISYEVAPTVDWGTDISVLPGIIPDPRQTHWTSCRVEVVGDTHHLHLPPRGVFTFGTTSGLNAPWAEVLHCPDDFLALDSNSATNIPPTEGLKYIQSHSVNALAHEHYRYILPREIYEALVSLPAGTILPKGSMYLFNQTTNTIIDDVVFRKPSNGEVSPWIIEISSETFDFDTVDTASEAEASYNSCGLSLITCGAPLSRNLCNLYNQFYNHTHANQAGRAGFAQPVSHNSLDHLNPPTSDHASQTAYPTYLPPWTASNWYKDSHTYLLSRGGSQASNERDLYNNAMLGDLLMANADTSGADSFLDATLTDDSFKIYFGDVTGPYIYATATGITGVHATGHGLVASGDTSSPAKSAFRIVPQDAEPTGPNAIGDMYVTTAGVLYICTSAGSPGTWTKVGTQS